MTIEFTEVEIITKHINSGLRKLAKDHPEFGIKSEHIGSASKRIVYPMIGEIVNECVQRIKSKIKKEFVYQEIQKENSELQLKIDSLRKSNKFLIDKLKENNIHI